MQILVLLYLTHSDAYIDLQGLDEKEALTLLSRIVNLNITGESRVVAKHIVVRLGFHALAITQAATYILRQRLMLQHFMDYYERRQKVIL